SVPRQTESLRRSRARASCFDLAIFRLGAGLERLQQSLRDLGHLADGSIEGRFIRLRRFGETADLSHELQRCGADLVFGCGRFKVEQCFDVAAHGTWSPFESWKEAQALRLCGDATLIFDAEPAVTVPRQRSMS